MKPLKKRLRKAKRNLMKDKVWAVSSLAHGRAPSWGALTPTTKKVLVGAAVFDGVLKAGALATLVRTPAPLIRGGKAAWAVALPLVNSVGVLPLAFLLAGRRRVSYGTVAGPRERSVYYDDLT